MTLMLRWFARANQGARTAAVKYERIVSGMMNIFMAKILMIVSTELFVAWGNTLSGDPETVIVTLTSKCDVKPRELRPRRPPRVCSAMRHSSGEGAT